MDDRANLRAAIEDADKIIEQAEAEAAHRRWLRRPKWMREPGRRVSRLTPQQSAERRGRNAERRGARAKTRRRRRHGRPAGR